MDETFVRVAGRWMYLFWAVDTYGQTVDFYRSEIRDREAAKCFLKRALANPDNRSPHVFARDKLRSYSAAIRELQSEGQLRPTCRQRARRYSNNRIDPARKAPLASHARAADDGDGVRSDCGYRGGANDSQRASARDYQIQSSWPGMSVRYPSRSRLAPVKLSTTNPFAPDLVAALPPQTRTVDAALKAPRENLRVC